MLSFFFLIYISTEELIFRHWKLTLKNDVAQNNLLFFSILPFVIRSRLRWSTLTSLRQSCRVSIKIPAIEGGENAPRGIPWRAATPVFYFRAGKTGPLKEYSADERAGCASRAFLLSSLFFFHWFRARGGKRAAGFPKKGKRLGMQVACASRACIRPRECDKLYEEARPKGSP